MQYVILEQIKDITLFWTGQESIGWTTYSWDAKRYPDKTTAQIVADVLNITHNCSCRVAPDLFTIR